MQHINTTFVCIKSPLVIIILLVSLHVQKYCRQLMFGSIFKNIRIINASYRMLS